MKLKTLAFIGALCASSSSFAGYLCTYYAQISQNDKYNSSGASVISGYNKASLAAILRQDRANFHAFGIRDYGDTADCVMHNKQQRAKFETYLRNGTASPAAIRQVVDGYPTLRVDLYTNYINVTIK